MKKHTPGPWAISKTAAPEYCQQSSRKAAIRAANALSLDEQEIEPGE